jgi:AraC family transcriptional regulator of adaptative response/methylated-DNA-[protein]-cysteine methyltransferase
MNARAEMVAADPVLEHARRLLDEGDHSLEALASATGLGPTSLQKRFRAAYGLSPAEYRAQVKFAALKRELRTSPGDLTRALYEAGFGSASRIYEDGAAKLGMLPGTYRRGGEGLEIRWTILDTELGKALVAATERGLCAIALGEDAAALQAELAREFPRATLRQVGDGRDEFLAPRVREVAKLLAGKQGKVDVELIGTAFQQRVWQALMKIPRGQTKSYAELAGELGIPRGARAIARACAQNRLAVVVPCHRIVRGDGSLGGYRWGLPKKEALLQSEQ